MAISSYTASGSKATTATKLPKGIYSVEIKSHELLKQAYLTHQANGRGNAAKTLKRGEVRGGGRKPWAQKGTGNARVGSIRSPLWRGGGITFGPSGNENYSKTLSTKARQASIRQALTLAVANKTFSTIDDFVVKSGKTKDAIKLLDKIKAGGRTTLVVSEITAKTDQAVRNLQDVKVVKAKYLSVVDVMDAHHLVVTKDALAVIETRLGGTK